MHPTPLTIDEVARKIYEERYVAPRDPALASILRDTMVREIVQRTIALTLGDLPPDLVGRLIDARRTRNSTRAVVHELQLDPQLRAMPMRMGVALMASRDAEDAWRDVLAALDTALKETST